MVYCSLDAKERVEKKVKGGGGDSSGGFWPFLPIKPDNALGLFLFLRFKQINRPGALPLQDLSITLSIRRR